MVMSSFQEQDARRMGHIVVEASNDMPKICMTLIDFGYVKATQDFLSGRVMASLPNCEIP